MKQLYVARSKIHYKDNHDVVAIIENNVLDVYGAYNIQKGDIVVDIGAGIGEFSIIASKLVGAEGNVIAIEPSPDDFETLLLNLEENGCKNVIPLSVGVSDRAKTIEIKFKGRNFRSETDSLDHILDNLRVERSRLKFMKMDVEGAEASIIPSSIEIVKSLDYLAMEMHDGNHAIIIPLLHNLGFRFERVSRKQYLLNAMKFSMKHPVQSCRIFIAFSRSGEWPGTRKVLTGIEIARSRDLVVGIFKKIQV